MTCSRNALRLPTFGTCEHTLVLAAVLAIGIAVAASVLVASSVAGPC